MTVRLATINDLELLAPLFDSYRRFYKQASDIPGAKAFLKDRIINKESVIYIAFNTENQTNIKTISGEANTVIPIGFTQLYSIFSSVTMEPMYLLNDLFIMPEYRSKGVGTALIEVVKERCRQENQKGIVLQTERENPAQQLYEHLGFNKDPDLHYFWATK